MSNNLHLLKATLTAAGFGVRAGMLLDGCGPDADKKPLLDDAAVGSAAATYANQSIRMQAVSAVQVWCDSEVPLDAKEGSADRLTALLVAVADADQSGELDADELAVLSQASDAAWAYLASKGVAEEDLDALFNSEDPDIANAAGDRVCGFMVDALPDGDAGAQTEMDDFAFGDAEAVAPMFDAAYKATMAFRGGKKVMVKKRISGSVMLSAAQRMAIKKMHAKSHGAMAMMHRMKSMRARKAAGK